MTQSIDIIPTSQAPLSDKPEIPKNATVAETLVALLYNAGVRQIFGVTGDALNGFNDALRRDGRIRWIGVRHEENAAYAAYAQAELTGGLGVCAGTVGPGALHLINGLYNAKREGGGVVAITGQVPTKERGTGYFQEVDLTKMFDDICDYQAIIGSPEQMPRLAEIALQKSLSERVVTRIEIPIDVMIEKVPNPQFAHPLMASRSTTLPPPSEIAKAVELIDGGKRVALFCGIGCRDARDEVMALSEKIKAPIIHTLRAKDIFDDHEAHVVGLTGLIGNPPGYHGVWDCDVLVMLGTNFPYDQFIPEGITIIQVDTKVENIGRRAPVTLGLVGTVKETVDAIGLQVKPVESSPFLEGLLKMRAKSKEHADSQASLTRTDEPLHPQTLTKVISDLSPDDTIFTVDVGEATVWAARHLQMTGTRRMIGSFNHGSMGSALPIALGAAALDPGRTVWAICGDGGFAMAMQDFITAVRYKWPIKVIVFNNSELGFVKMENEVAGFPLNPEATDLVNPDFAAYARICGGVGIRVEHAADIEPAIREALASDKPVIIDAIVSAGELTLPPHIELKQAWGFGMSKAKEGLLALNGDHDQFANWASELRSNLTLAALRLRVSFESVS